MKELLSRVFFVSDCARGAVLAMTVLTAGNVLWWRLVHLTLLSAGRYFPSILSWHGIYPPFFRTYVGGASLITLYALALAVRALIALVKLLRRERRFRALRHLLLAGLCLAAGTVGAIRVFPPMYVFAMYMGADRAEPDAWVSSGFPGLPPQCWAAVFAGSLLLIIAGGLLLAAMFAAAAGKRFRDAFGPAALTLWGVLALWHLAALGVALYVSGGNAALLQTAERRFGRPLTAAGLEAMYRESGTIDADFWEKQ